MSCITTLSGAQSADARVAAATRAVLPILALLVMLVGLADAQQLQARLESAPVVGDMFGTSVAVEGDWIVVGAPWDMFPPTSGAVWLFRREGSGWAEHARIDAETPLAAEFFGFCVDLRADTVAVGASYTGVSEWPKHVYLLERDDAGTPDDLADDSWAQVARLERPPNDPTGSFARVLELGDDVLVAGAPGDETLAVQGGAVYVYRRDDAGWVLHDQLLPPGGLLFGFQYGTSVSLSADDLAVGAPNEDGYGVVHLWWRDRMGTLDDPSDDVWSETGTLPMPPGPGQAFGKVVALEGDVLAVLSSGSAPRVRVFQRDGGGVWTLLDELAPPGLLMDIDLDGDLLAIVSVVTGETLDATSSLVHVRDDGGTPGDPWDDTWPLAAEVELPDVEWYATWSRVSVDGDTLIVGQPGWESTDVPDGAAWVHSMAWTNLGEALAGAQGPPLLEGFGQLVAGSQNELVLSGALPGSTTNLVLGITALGLPFKGGVLVPSPDVIALDLVDGAGEHRLPFTWTPDLPPGSVFLLQHWIVDPTGPAGLASSNGLRGRSP